MEELATRKNLIITNADKVGAVVIKYTDSSIKEANRQLSDEASYKQLTQGPTLQHIRMVNQTIKGSKKRSYLLKKLQMEVSHPNTPKFYIYNFTYMCPRARTLQLHRKHPLTHQTNLLLS